MNGKSYCSSHLLYDWDSFHGPHHGPRTVYESWTLHHKRTRPTTNPRPPIGPYLALKLHQDTWVSTELWDAPSVYLPLQIRTTVPREWNVLVSPDTTWSSSGELFHTLTQTDSVDRELLQEELTSRLRLWVQSNTSKDPGSQVGVSKDLSRSW